MDIPPVLRSGTRPKDAPHPSAWTRRYFEDGNVQVLKPRRRLVSFRLSEEEYQRLEAACEARQFRSVSDFVRSTIWAVLDLWESGQGIGAPMHEIALAVQANTQQMAELDRELKHLSLLLGHTDKQEAPAPEEDDGAGG